MKIRMFHLHAITPLHVGIGQAVGVVDLPIAREKATNFPMVPGSAIKGVLRDEFHDEHDKKQIFGPEKISDDSQAQAGALAFGDAHLLLFPVRSLHGVMALVTCPFVLRRYVEDMRRSGIDTLPAVPPLSDNQALVGQDNANLLSGKVLLEDLDLDGKQDDTASKWAHWFVSQMYAGQADLQAEMQKHIVLVADEVFSFLVDTATEVRSRIRIDDGRRVVQRGALWYEENLPAESVLWGVVGIGKSRGGIKGDLVRDEQQMEQVWNTGLSRITTLQLGGKATVGRGLIRFLA